MKLWKESLAHWVQTVDAYKMDKTRGVRESDKNTEREQRTCFA